MTEPLRAISNVIELKPDKQYLLVFKGDELPEGALREITEYLLGHGIRGVYVALRKGTELEVIEAPATLRRDWGD